MDIVVIISGDDLAKSDCLILKLKRLPGLSLVFSQTAERLAEGVEHFGFKDNISQSILAGMPVVQAARSERGADEVPPGGICIGLSDSGSRQFERERWNGPVGFAALDGEWIVLRNSLRQDVAQFHGFVAREASHRNLTSIELAAQIMGRCPDGSKARPPDHLPERRVPTNHIEKMNPSAIGPRPGLSVPNTVDTRKHRILRRGIPFGSRFISTFANPIEDGEHRGLMFVCYQSSIVNQFEFVQRRWANEANFPRENGGMDPIIGQALDGEPRVLRIGGESAMLRVMESWVTMTGGDYFFSPSP